MNQYAADTNISFQMLTPVGRPFKFGEPTVRREVRLPESLNERLTEYARNRGEDVSDVVRSALEARLEGKEEAVKSLIGPEDVRLAMSEAIREERKANTFRIRLPKPARECAEELASIIGYEPENLIEDVMRNLLRRPEEIQELLLGSGIRTYQIALEEQGRMDLVKAGQAELNKLSARVAAVGGAKVGEVKPKAVRKKKAA